MPVDEAVLGEFAKTFARDLGAALHASTVVIGDKLGLYRALADIGPSDAATVATATGCDARLVQEWLDAQYVSGYCHHSARTGTYWLSPEQAAVLADRASPSLLVGSMALAAATAKDEEKIRGAFTSSGGLAWHEHHHDAFHGTERLFKPGYAAHLVAHWVPALDGVDDTLGRGASVADVGCGHGASSILLAEAYPLATITGFDAHRASIDVARKRAVEAGVADRVHFEVATAHDFPGAHYDLVCAFDAFGTIGDPCGAARHIRDALATDGTWLLVEPMAGGSLDANVGPVGRIFYALAATVSTPAALAQPGDRVLGNQATEAALAALTADAGFRRFRRVAQTRFNRVFEVRP
jgi:2-polyprenyl-3-methyl-5-hydroxy-6-metoxy-1,4-benzoquinol methylase